MIFKHTSTYTEMSELASDYMVEILKKKPNALFCIATGDSPTLCYEEFVRKIKKDEINYSEMRVLKLDEWCGIPGSHPATCEYYIRKHILDPLKISDSRYIHFDGMADDANAECKRISDEIVQAGGIDLCILGIGKDGHLGLNEPGEELIPYTHKAVLNPNTRTHAMLKDTGADAINGFTIGIKDILNSRAIMLLITGNDKQESWNNLQKNVISSRYPANYLKLHNNTICFVDDSILH